LNIHHNFAITDCIDYFAGGGSAAIAAVDARVDYTGFVFNEALKGHTEGADTSAPPMTGQWPIVAGRRTLSPWPAHTRPGVARRNPVAGQGPAKTLPVADPRPVALLLASQTPRRGQPAAGCGLHVHKFIPERNPPPNSSAALGTNGPTCWSPRSTLGNRSIDGSKLAGLEASNAAGAKTKPKQAHTPRTWPHDKNKPNYGVHCIWPGLGRARAAKRVIPAK
jgi:hypothetical protein